MTMNRRDFIRSIGASGLALAALPSSTYAEEPYEGPLLLTINALGGWDISNFCDPKGGAMNQRYNTGDIETAGAFNYAPLDTNGEFFRRHASEILLINGIDVQTGGHSEAARHMWSGALADNGTAALAPLFAARHLESLNVPAPFISSGGFSRTGELVPLTRLTDPTALTSIALYENERGIHNAGRYVDDFVLDEVFEARRIRHERASSRELPRARAQRSALFASQLSAASLRRYREYLPAAGSPLSVWQGTAATSLAALKAGVAASASIYVSDFDTHTNHEALHAIKLQELLATITYALDRAEELGLRDRLTVLVTSEFSRTPEYGMNGGKDHWPVNSMMLIGPGIEGNRVFGATDEGLRPRNVNLATLDLDDAGERLHPGHLHTAIREHLDLTDFARQVGFDLRMPSVPLFT